MRMCVPLLALALASAASAQTPPASAPAAAPAAKPAAGKPVAGNPAAGKPVAKKPAPARPAAAAKPAPAPSGPCGIGVVTAFHDRFNVQNVGFTVFGNARKEVLVPSWGIDDVIVARVRAAAPPRVVVRRIGYAREVFERQFDTTQLTYGSDSDLAAAVKAVAASGGCARYVAVVPYSGRFGGTNQLFTGVGAVHAGFGNGRTYVHALTRIRLYDGRDFSVLKRADGGSSSKDSSFSIFVKPDAPLGAPSRELKDFAWPDDKLETVAPAARAAALAVLAESLDKTLPELLAP